MASNEVDHALSLPVEQVGAALTALHEDQWFDRKSASIQPKKLAEALVAFANAEGGIIVIGLSDGQVEGVGQLGKKENDLRQAAIDFTSPPVRASFHKAKCINREGVEDCLLVVRIEPGERVHETHTGDCYLRVGDESRKLSYSNRQELEFDKGQSQYDGFAAEGVSIADIDLKLLGQFKESIGAAHVENVKVLRARSLVTRSGEITNAGYLLFGEYPQDVFPQAYIRILRFLDTKRGTGARLGLEEGADIRIEGSIPRAIQAAVSKIDELIPKRRSLSESGLFEGRPIVPKDAWLEGLVNAVIHRSYSLAGDHIRFEIYPNRIEIESPGRFPGLANPSSPLEISRFARNPRIARVCADLRIGQELGEGIKRIFEEMRIVGLTDPVYKQTSGSVRLSLAAIPRIDPRVAQRLPAGSQKVLDIIRSSDSPLGTGQIADALGMSRPAANARLKALETEGFLRWNGKSPKDPRAVWELSDDWA
ncbi:ATP-binding protein [Streptomyces sp. DSM 41014]|uniref:ATP-binding protein n=1 Tax=Streptomyces hintoniae TaxID=3075521 RepID=A0ABU2UUM2_9ACTN|nr:RNA-binding domain-containing protein [Streptomyces sp. DSM 41014]MDT0476740.1 ATP-binding protein [Streptomyces sp. DSM 41014]